MFQRDMEKVIDTVFDTLKGQLVKGGRIELRGFGAFSVRRREARTARNPKTGEEVSVGERHAIYFRAGKELREKVNRQDG